MAENITFVPSRLKSSVVGGYVTGADQVYDDTLGKSQAEVNAGIDIIVKEKVDEKIAEGISDTVTEIVEAKVSTAVDEKLEDLDIEDTNTTYKLSVNGTAYGDSEGVDLGSVYAPVSAGSNGQFLMSNGSGAPVWAEIPSGGGASVVVEPVDTADDSWNNFNLR